MVNEMRVSIKRHNQQYLQRLAAQMEVEPSEAVNYLLLEIKRVGYSFNSGINLAVGSLEKTQEIATTVEDNPPIPMGSTGSLMRALQNDPVIEKLISVGLDQF
jgi:hypothetical protein